MKRTQTLLSRATVAACLGIAATSAHAVPIVFEFSGTVDRSYIYQYATGQRTYDDSQTGQTVTGRITVETEGLPYFAESTEYGWSASYGDTVLDPAEQITSELHIGGVAYDVGGYPADAGSVSAVDVNPALCTTCGPSWDEIILSDLSNTYQLDPLPAPGQYFSRSLTLRWYDLSDPYGLIDLSGGFTPQDLMPWVSALMPIGNYNQNTLNCADGYCMGITQSTTTFSIDSLTVSMASVPEPETLALFAIGLLGTGLARRGRRR